MMQRATPFIWAFLVGALLLLKRQTGGVRRRVELSPAEAMFRDRLLETACRAALADGTVEQREVAIVAAIAEKFTAGPVDPDRLRKMIGYIRVQPPPPDLTHLGQGLNDVGRNQLLRAAMVVIGPQNRDHGSGKAFIDRLAMDLLIDPARREALAATL
jgi:uncharacterized membrane protein YebE (DUF533 family)